VPFPVSDDLTNATLDSRSEVPEGPEPLDALYARYWRELCGYVEQKFGKGPPEPEDVVQLAFMKFAHFTRKNLIENPKAFLYATVRNVVIDHHRRTRIVTAYARDVERRAADDEAYEISPERVLLDRERLKIFSEALTRMPRQRRRMVLMNRFEGLSCEDIGRRLGVSTSTVQKQVVRGIADCLSYLEKADQGHEVRGEEEED
jgi:RNA polymerase sigma factor (sigma-70 family)